MSEIHKRGFASLSPERKRELSKRGVAAAKKAGTQHRWTAEEARAAGKKGLVSRRRQKQSEKL